QQLRELNCALEYLIDASRSDTEVLLEALEKCIAPLAVASFRRRGSGPWVLSAQFAVDGVRRIFEPEQAEGYSRFSFKTGDEEFLLLVLPAEATLTAWQSELC